MRSAATTLDHDKRAIVVGTITFAVGLTLQWRLHGWNDAKDNFLETVMTVMAPTLAVGVPWFVICLLCTPSRMHRELEDKIVDYERKLSPAHPYEDLRKPLWRLVRRYREMNGAPDAEIFASAPTVSDLKNEGAYRESLDHLLRCGYIKTALVHHVLGPQPPVLQNINVSVFDGQSVILTDQGFEWATHAFGIK